MTYETDIFAQFSLKEMVEKKLKRVVRYTAKTNNKGNLYWQVIREIEESLIRLTIEEAAHKQTKAAQILGINRNTLRKKMKEFGL
jgi:Fis family transcriptional regulator